MNSVTPARGRPRAARPRLVLLEGALRENGGLRVTHGLVRQWVADGRDAKLVVVENVPPLTPMFTPDPSVPWVYASGKVRRFRNALPFAVLGLIRHTARADVVISGSEVGWQLILGRLVTWLLRKPFLTLVQAPVGQAVDAWEPARLRPLLRWTLRHVDQAICVSPGLVAQVEENGLAPEKVAVVPVGIDVDDVINRGRVTVDLRDDLAVPTLVGMGRLAPAKGFDVLIEASAKLRADDVPHRIRIAGEGPDRADLQAAIDRHGLQNVIELVGFVDDPQPVIASADVFVLPSRHEGNGGLVLLEALAHGRPVIAADCETGPREMLRDGELGDLVPPEDPGALAAAISRHLRDPQYLQGKAEGGPARARQFDESETARNMLRHVLNTVRAPARLRPRRD
jgi:glycosyltransferase involved in cell wall biosynthesis